MSRITDADKFTWHSHLLKIQIKGYEAKISGIESSLDSALKHPDPTNTAEDQENYIRTCREELERTKALLNIAEMELVLALNPPV